eukprot:jgi/Botrbrau1/9708/Bobra.0388s0003.1
MGRQGALVRVITGGASAVLRQQVDACRGLASGCYRNFASLPAESSIEAPVNSKDGKVLHPDLLNDNFRRAQYAVRGELYLKGEELRKAGREIIFTNVGNPHVLGQPPITYNRQVQALVNAPFLLDNPEATKLFPPDTIARARKLLSKEFFPGGVGAYSDSRGAEGVRREVAAYIQKRDGFPSDPDAIFLTDGASPAVRYILNAIIRDEHDGILVPIPQYPLYSASIQLYGGQLIGYQLDEKAGWGMDMGSMKEAVEAARARGTAVRAIVFINPGNPTGQCLTRQNLEELIKFAHKEKLVLMADEVYQENIYQDQKPFVSAKKVLMEMGEPYASNVELVSFHTVSKGSLGECGIRGGYLEAINLHPGTIDEIYKIASINLSPNIMGQVAMSLMCNTPKEGGPLFRPVQEGAG